MSMTTLERAVLAGAKLTFNNPKLKMKDIQEWSTEVQSGEISAWIPDPGVYVTIKRENDKRVKGE